MPAFVHESATPSFEVLLLLHQSRLSFQLELTASVSCARIGIDHPIKSHVE